MAGIMDENAQWIILMGFIISIGIFFLAILLNQSMLVGQTTAEAVMEFPKPEIQDLRSEIQTLHVRYEIPLASDPISKNRSIDDITNISMSIGSEYVSIKQIPGINPGEVNISQIHYNNGITAYDEKIQYWDY